MWLDIIIASIFIFSTVYGYKKGFIRTVIHAIGWFLAMIISFVYYPRIAKFLYNKTGLYDSIRRLIPVEPGGEGSSLTEPTAANLPVIFKDTLDSTHQKLLSILADEFSGFLFNVVCFLLVVIAIRLILLFISNLFSGRSRSGIGGFVDSVLGLICGMLKGGILIFLFLTLLVPMISFSNNSFIADSLSNSQFAGMLYDNNLFFLISRGSF